MKLRRYHGDRRGSFQIRLWLCDWELSTIVGALRLFRKHHRGNKAYSSRIQRLENKFSIALGRLLKVELRDLKLRKNKALI